MIGKIRTTAGAVDGRKVVNGLSLLHEQALDSADPRATVSRLLEELEASCRAISIIFGGSSALRVMAAADTSLPWMMAFLTWLRLFKA